VNPYDLIEAQAMAARVACEQMTGPALTAMRDSMQRTSSLPARPGWERKATAHAEIFRLLADAAGTPGALPREAGLVRDLMLTVGPGADGLITSSRRRLLACLQAGDPDGAAAEMEDHLRVLHFMARLASRPVPPSRSPGTARKGT
jgi:DNA-binding FadR family transcriptional regulator